MGAPQPRLELTAVDLLRKFRRSVTKDTFRRVRNASAPILRMVEKVLFGGEPRRSILRALWLAHMRSSIRRDLWWAKDGEELHFSTHTETFNEFANAARTIDAQNFNRAFFTSLVIEDGDTVLDIGCGEGFFTKRFYAHRAKLVHAIDIDAGAIRRARRRNRDPRVQFFEADATSFVPPLPNYDVIVWDGAIGHFSAAQSDRVLRTIVSCLDADGIFCGSESLRHYGGDHLQAWASEDDLAALLRQHFRHVEIFSTEYRGGFSNEHVRHEAYWRCSQVESRLERARWQRFS